MICATVPPRQQPVYVDFHKNRKEENSTNMVSQSNIFVVKQGGSLAWETPTAKRPPGKIRTRQITIKIWTNLNLKTHKTNTRPTRLKQVWELLQGQSHDQTKTGTNLRTWSETRGTSETRMNLWWDDWTYSDCLSLYKPETETAKRRTTFGSKWGNV